jgi:hypothetical protein
MGHKPNIGAVISKGSVKQRLMLFFNDIALRNTDKVGYLSDAERDIILDSFKTPKERELFDLYDRIDTVMISALPYISQYRLLWRGWITKIDGLVNYYYTMLQQMDVYNQIICSDGLPEPTKVNIIKIITEEIYLYWGGFVYDNDEGVIIYDIDKDVNNSKHKEGILHLINTFKDLAIRDLSILKASLTAAQELIDKNDFNIQSYKDYIKEVGDEVVNYEPTVFLTNYNGIDFYPPKYGDIEMDKEVYKRIIEGL